MKVHHCENKPFHLRGISRDLIRELVCDYLLCLSVALRGLLFVTAYLCLERPGNYYYVGNRRRRHLEVQKLGVGWHSVSCRARTDRPSYASHWEEGECLCLWVCVCVCACLWVCVCRCICLWACVSLSVHACECVCVCACLWACVCVSRKGAMPPGHRVKTSCSNPISQNVFPPQLCVSVPHSPVLYILPFNFTLTSQGFVCCVQLHRTLLPPSRHYVNPQHSIQL